MTATIQFYVFLAFLAPLCVMHVSDILVNGSVFEGLRSYIAYRRDSGDRFFGILNQLFTCMLCMNTQVSIFLTSVPAALLADRYFKNVFVDGLVGLVFAIAVAGLALGIWMLFQYSPTRYHTLRKENQRLRATVRGLQTAARRPITDEERAAFLTAFSLVAFKEVTNLCEEVCSDIGCDTMEEFCRYETIELWYVRWSELYWEIAGFYPDLAAELPDAVSRFLHSSRGYSEGTPRREELLQYEYDSLVERM